MSQQAEHALITALLAGCSVEAAVAVRPEDFADLRAGAIWRAGWELIDMDRSVTVVALERSLRALEKWEFVGGFEGLMRFDSASGWATSAQVQEAATEVRRSAKLRSLHQLGRELSEATQGEDADPGAIFSEFAARLDSAGAQDGSGERLTLADAMTQRLDQARREAAGEADRTRIPTGLACLDEYLRGGWRPTWLVGVAGAAKMGKTALAGGFARAAANTGYPVLFVSQEMAGVELAERELAARAEVPIESIDAGPRDLEWRSLIAAADRAKKQRFEIVDRPVDWSRLQSIARRWRRENRDRPGLVVVDYLQLLDIRSQRGVTRDQELAKVTRNAKRLAAELYSCVMLLAQFNDYKIATREDKRPRSTDVRESGSLNKDANLLLGLHRPWVYDREANPGDAEIHALVNRHGSPRVLKTTFAPRITAFGEQRA